MSHGRSVGPFEYQAFGGGACELWGLAVPEVPIRKYVDFTGDLDVRVNPPKFTIDDPKLIADLEQDDIDPDPSLMELILLDEGGFTEYGDAVTRWLYEELVNRVRELSPYFNKPGFVIPDYREDDETAVSDLRTVVGNLLICRSPMLDRGMIKIQVSTKIESESTAEMNHIMELILVPKGRFPNMRNNNFRVNGIYLQEPLSLLKDQVSGLVGRSTGILNTISAHPDIGKAENYPGFYKLDNHCARLLYLAHLLKAVEGKRVAGSSKQVDSLSKPEAMMLLKTIYASGSDKLCYKHFGEDYMDRLIAVFESMKYVKAGWLTTKLDQQDRALLNKAKAKARAVGGRRRTRRH